jgi:TonB family protein
MELNRTKWIAVAGTILFHLLLLIYLLIGRLDRSTPVKPEEGVLVHLGTVDLSSGTFLPEERVSPSPAENKPAMDPADEALITQQIEPSVSLTAPKKKEKTALPDKRQTEQQTAAEISRQTATAFAKSQQAANQGTEKTGTDIEGQPAGSAVSTSANGGRQGYGHFSLSGRSVEGSLPLPDYPIQEEGTVVVRIVVNPEGQVVQASINLQGTTTENPTLRSAALNAARRARFNPINSSNPQSGTITYHYKLK